MEVIRLVGVIRQSKKVGDQAISEESQRSAITDGIEIKNRQEVGRRRYEIVGWASDIGVSADKTDPWQREALGDWLKNRTAEFDGLVSWKLDRLCRSILDFAKFMKWLDDNRKIYICTNDPIDLSNDMGRALATILAVLADLELKNIKARNKQTRKTLNEAGRWTGGRVPYGRRPVKTEKGWTLVKDPITSMKLAEIVEWILDGQSLSSIALKLNVDEVPTPQDQHTENFGRAAEKKHYWTGTNLGQLLRSRHLIGEREVGGKVLRKADGSAVMYCEPVMTPTEWKRLQKALDALSDAKGKNHQKTSLLRKVGTCGACGENLHVTNTGGGKNTRRIPRYRCASYAHKGLGRVAEHCGNPSIQQPTIEGYLEESVLSRVGHLPRMVKVFVPGEDHGEELEQLEDAIKGVRRERDLGLYDGDEEGYLTRLTSLVERRKSLLTIPSRPAGYDYRPSGQTVAEYWEHLDREGRNRWLREMGVQLSYDRREGYEMWDLNWGDLEHLERLAQGIG
ncbi:recombinase family protein [Streptosporangium canum]|uniref:recombinase family protein n=1 Tax=Streptosporangium canum TaxID=324952 RepID=UPI0033B67014